MAFNFWSVYTWLFRLTCLAVFFQSIENFFLRNELSNIWNWKVMKKDFTGSPHAFQTFFDFIFEPKVFTVLVCFQMILSFSGFFFPVPVFFVVLFFLTLFISIRWRGAFNGGADSMTIVVLSSLGVASFFSGYESGLKACFWYLTTHVVLSYFVSGIVKIRNKSWRQGLALVRFVEDGAYDVPRVFLRILKTPFLSFLVSWLILFFECTFPLCLVNRNLCFVYLGLGVIFHFGNFLVFGLNRFFWIWISTYPVVLFCSRS